MREMAQFLTRWTGGRSAVDAAFRSCDPREERSSFESKLRPSR
jgi:hypothetical protein